MCGRFVLKDNDGMAAHLHEGFGLPEWVTQPPRYNIAPAQLVPVVVTQSGAPRVAEMKWGLVPARNISAKPGPAPINARSEEAFDKAMFRDRLQRWRCLVPADAYYEWRSAAPAIRQPYCIALRSRAPLFFAGIYEPATATRPGTFALFTTRSSGMLQEIHHRMPLILPLPAGKHWLAEGGLSRDDYRQLCTPFPAEDLEAWPVSSLVNRPANDGPACMEPVAISSVRSPGPAAPGQGTFEF